MTNADVVQTHAALSNMICDALQREHDGFFDALYSAETEADDSRRELIGQMRDASKQMFAQARAKLGGAAVAVESSRQEGTTWITVVAATGGPRLEVVVDDVFKRGETIQTRDIIQIRLSK